MDNRRRTSEDTVPAGDEGDDIDSILNAVGFGKWQIPIFLLTFLAVASYPVHYIGAAFLNAPRDFRCFSSVGEVSLCGINDTSCQSQNNILAESNSTYYDNKCLPYKSPGGKDGNSVPMNATLAYDADEALRGKQRRTLLRSCPIIEYDTTFYTSTVVSQYDMVCERTYMRPFFTTVGTIGNVFGSMLGGYMGDRWGRVRAVRISAIIMTVSILVLAFWNNYYIMLLARFISAGTSISALVPSWSYAIESSPSHQRAMVGMFMGLPFSIFIVEMAGVAYYIRTWQYLLLACSVQTVVLMIFSFFIHESPRWLLQKCQADEAKKIFHRAVKLNGTEKDLDVDAAVDRYIRACKVDTSTSGNQETGQSVLKSARELFSSLWSPAIRVTLILLGLNWMMHNFLYVGVTINANNFTDDPFLYVALSGAVDASSICLMSPLTKWFGRKTIMIAFHLLSGVLYFVHLAVPSDLEWLRWIVVMSAFFSISGTMQVNYLYGPEVFPTEFRVRGFAFLQVMGSIGTAIAPFVTDVLPLVYKSGPYIAFGIASILAALALPVLPETRNKPLPDTFQEMEEKRRRKKEKRLAEQNGVLNRGYEEDSAERV